VIHFGDLLGSVCCCFHVHIMDYLAAYVKYLDKIVSVSAHGSRAWSMVRREANRGG